MVRYNPRERLDVADELLARDGHTHACDIALQTNMPLLGLRLTE